MTELTHSRSATGTDFGVAVLRIAVGLTFLAHGLLKGLGMGFAGTAGFFAQVGAPFPAVTSVLIIVLESVGGLLLVLGLLTRPVGVLLACDMLGAIVLARHDGFFAPKGGELEILLLSCALALALAGAGAWSLDALIARRRHG